MSHEILIKSPQKEGSSSALHATDEVWYPAQGTEKEVELAQPMLTITSLDPPVRPGCEPRNPRLSLILGFGDCVHTQEIRNLHQEQA